MQQFLTKTVREIALEAPKTTRVFEEYKIDYCCHGDTPFRDACQRIGADPDVVMHKIDDLLEADDISESVRHTERSLTDLVDHLLSTHHVYTKNEIENLTPLMAKVATRHGEHYPYLLELKSTFQQICDDLGPHMMKEEMVLFPYIVELERKHALQISGRGAAFGTVSNPVRMMQIEHEEVGELLARMRELTSDYSLPEGACPSFTALYHRLGDFEKDLHQHIHLENNLLFPRAIQLEEKSLSSAVM